MRNRQSIHLGMTLVELLVVVAIIGLLLAVSVPLIKPRLESRKTFDAAQVLSRAFQYARIKSIQEGKSYGIKLIPFANAPTVSLQLLTQKGGTVSFVNNPEVRVKVVSGIIVPYIYDDSAGKWQKSNTAASLFEEGDLIQFNYLGRWFKIGTVTGDGFALLDTEDTNVSYENLNLPDAPASNDAMQYRITRTLDKSLAWIPPVVMPQGTVVDLVFSGGETLNFSGEDKTSDDITPYFSLGDDVVVMFSPAGHVDLLYVNGESKKVNEMLYFCVGDWDRQVDINGKTLADNGQSNLRTPATYWVTLHPKTGGVHITENAPILPETNLLPENNDAEKREKKTAELRDARRFAREHFFNVGGR